MSDKPTKEQMTVDEAWLERIRISHDGIPDWKETFAIRDYFRQMLAVLRAATKRTVMRTQIELEALLTERAGMDAENATRAQGGNSPAYGIDHYQELASRIRDLGIAVVEPSAGEEGEDD